MQPDKWKEKGTGPALRDPKLREGGSARARFYRLKDELLDFSFEDILSVTKRSNELSEEVASLYKPLVDVKARLDADVDDEAALLEGEAALRRVSERMGELGVRGPA